MVQKQLLNRKRVKWGKNSVPVISQTGSNQVKRTLCLTLKQLKYRKNSVPPLTETRPVKRDRPHPPLPALALEKQIPLLAQRWRLYRVNDLLRELGRLCYRVCYGFDTIRVR